MERGVAALEKTDSLRIALVEVGGGKRKAEKVK
jgi:hypothetical protein